MNETSVHQRWSMGYKRTEVGVIPEEWDVATLGKITTITTGNTPPTHDAANYGDEYSFVSPVDLGEAKYVVKTEKMLSKKGFGISQRFPADSILFVCIGSTIGKCGIAPIELTSNQQINAVLPSPSFSTDYLYYTICSAVPRIKALAGEQAVPIVNKTQFSETVIPMAPLYEQRAIAEALSDVDELLSALEELIAKKRAIKQAAMQQLLTGKTRLPGFSEEWETKRLEEIFAIRVGSSKSQHIANGGRYFIVDMGSVAIDGRLISAKRTDYDGDFLAEGELVMPKDDIGGGKIIGKVAYMDANDLYVLGDHVYALRLMRGYPKFFSYLINRHETNSSLKSKVGGSAQLGLSRKAVEEQKVPVPTLKEQIAIAAILSDMDAEIAALERRRDKARVIKQGMMQQLLTGQIRLIQPETITEELAVARPVRRTHNWQFNEAVVISVLAKHFGNEQYPLGRMRYTKLSYLLHRYEEGHAEGYLKKAAGPYNPQTRYGGPEKIALQKDYVCQYRNGKRQGFIASTNVGEAERYFNRWYGSEVLQWLKQFRYETNNDLELLTTVDMAAEELCEAGEEVSVESIKKVIRSHPEWNPKLDRSIFSDTNLASAIESCQKLFRRKQ